MNLTTQPLGRTALPYDAGIFLFPATKPIASAEACTDDSIIGCTGVVDHLSANSSIRK